jgi:hypothetical protein
MYKLTLTISFIMLSFFAIAQKANVKGKVLNADGTKAVPEATVTIPKAKVISSTNENGVFTFSNIPFGTYEIIISADGFVEETSSITVGEKNTDVGNINLEPNVATATATADNATSTSTEDANDQDNGGSSTQNVGSALSASRDPFNSAAGYNWGSYFFKQRGYDGNANQVFLNGIQMNELEDGNASFNIWGGLNDVFRSNSTTHGLMPNEMAFGGLGNTTVLDASAGAQRKQTRITYSNTNRNYRDRIMITKSTGIMKNGWAFTGSLSYRWANKGPIAGTFYQGLSAFGAAEKKIKNHSIGLIALSNNVKRGKSAPSMKENFEILNDNLYNPNWGYQGGKVRNTKVLTQSVPLFVLTDEIALKSNSRLVLSASFQTGNIQNTNLDWYNSANPSPDYYRYLPSYATTEWGDSAGYAVRDAIQADPSLMQVNWDNMYQANKFPAYNMPGQTGNRSKYIQGADVENQKRFNLAANYQKVINGNFTLYAGANTQIQSLHNYRKIVDLLGGDYWVNVNQFAERTFSGLSNVGNNNVNDASTIKKLGDIYSYNYKMNFMKSQLWGQGIFTFSKVDLFATVNLSNTSFSRTGLYKSGIYGDNSYGKSAVQSYMNYNAKGGATYKINGRNYLYANVAKGTFAPLYDNVLISPRTRNEISMFNKSEQMSSFEAGYMLRSPNLKLRLTFYDTELKDGADVKRYFDQIISSFVNMNITGINRRHTGIEIGAEAKITTSLSATFATSLAQSFYTNRPLITTYIDNDTTGGISQEFSTGDSMWTKNLSLPNGPQSAASLGFVYRSPKFWMATITFNKLGDNYIDFAPNRHTTYGLDLVKYIQGVPVYTTDITQKKLNSIFTIDASFSKSWRAQKIVKSAPVKSLFFVNIGITNLLNNKNIQILGFEQLRVDNTRPNLFDAKYSYALGAQYFINLAYSF